MWFQQDGCKAHYGHAVRESLDGEYQGRWRGRSGTISWPACSPDLNPLFIYYWRAVKGKVLKPIEHLNELRHIITEAVEVVNNGRFAHLINRSFLRQCRAYIAAEERQLEHLLYIFYIC
nr:unnamed protein product [Callosobruchus chinensis]